MTQSCLEYFALANAIQSEKVSLFSLDHSMEEYQRHCTKFVTPGGYIKIFLVIRCCTRGRLSKYSGPKMHGSKLPKTRQCSIEVFSFFAPMCIVINYKREHAATYGENL